MDALEQLDAVIDDELNATVRTRDRCGTAAALHAGNFHSVLAGRPAAGAPR